MRSPRGRESRSSRATWWSCATATSPSGRPTPDWVPRVSPHPGMHLSCLEWFREKDIAAISWDMMDERPIGYAGFGMGVHLAIPFLGLALVDNTNPERLAQACREEGRYEFLFTATPIRLVGSTGAPAHPLAIF